MDFGSASLSVVSITSHCADNAFQILNLTKETKRLLPSVILSVTVPHTLSLPDQVWKSTWHAKFKLKKSHFLINLHLIFIGQAGRAIRTGRCWHHPNRGRKMLYSIKGWCSWINREGNTTHLWSTANKDYVICWICCYSVSISIDLLIQSQKSKGLRNTCD